MNYNLFKKDQPKVHRLYTDAGTENSSDTGQDILRNLLETQHCIRYTDDLQLNTDIVTLSNKHRINGSKT